MWEAPACEPPLGQVLAVVEVVLQKTKGHTFTITFLAYVDLSQERPVEFQARALYLDTHETVYSPRTKATAHSPDTRCRCPCCGVGGGTGGC
jgi:hypothetical protein